MRRVWKTFDFETLCSFIVQSHVTPKTFFQILIFVITLDVLFSLVILVLLSGASQRTFMAEEWYLDQCLLLFMTLICYQEDHVAVRGGLRFILHVKQPLNSKSTPSEWCRRLQLPLWKKHFSPHFCPELSHPRVSVLCKLWGPSWWRSEAIAAKTMVGVVGTATQVAV